MKTRSNLVVACAVTTVLTLSTAPRSIDAQSALERNPLLLPSAAKSPPPAPSKLAKGKTSAKTARDSKDKPTTKAKKKTDAKSAKKQESPAVDALLDDPLAATFNPVPSFGRVKSDIEMVGSGLEPLLKLDTELQTLGQQLTEQVRKLADNQNDPVAASEANKLVTKIQSRLISTIGEVLVSSDLIELGIDSANRKLGSLEKYLTRTESRFKSGAKKLTTTIKDQREKAIDAVNRYIDFVDGLSDPISREDKLEALKLEAKVQEQKFQLDLFRLDERRQKAVAKGYANMRVALGRWIDDFHALKSKTKVMVKQLEAEQAFLAKGVKMSVDAARVRHFMENPLSLPDGTPIRAVNEKIAKIFSMIEVFTGVQGRIQDSLFGFNAIEVQETIASREEELTGMRKRALDLKAQILR